MRWVEDFGTNGRIRREPCCYFGERRPLRRLQGVLRPHRQRRCLVQAGCRRYPQKARRYMVIVGIAITGSRPIRKGSDFESDSLRASENTTVVSRREPRSSIMEGSGRPEVLGGHHHHNKERDLFVYPQPSSISPSFFLLPYPQRALSPAILHPSAIKSSKMPPRTAPRWPCLSSQSTSGACTACGLP